MNKLYRSLVLTSGLAAALAGCGDDVTVTEPPPPPPPPAAQVRQVSVAPDGVTVSPGQTLQMTAAVTADAGCNATVTWSASDATRASVSASGLVTVAAAATSGPVAIRATATCAAGGATGNGVATLNVVGTTITAVTITPALATLNAGTSLSAPQTLQATAAVSGTNNPAQTVDWSSLDATLATVSSAGIITANNTGLGGNVVIKACSTVNTAICGTAAITVVVPSPASVQIQAVTFNNGTNNVPVNLQNVFGQIEVSLNVEAGARNLTRVDALIGGQVVATQTFSSASAAAAPEATATLIILSTNTAQVRQNGGIFVPVIFNGNSAITANLYVSGSSTPLASNAIPVVMNNPDAVIRRPAGTRPASLGPTATSPSAVSNIDGETYYKGTQTVDGYDYVAFGKTVPDEVDLDSSVCGFSDNLVPAGASATGGIALNGLYDCGASNAIAGTGNEGGNDVNEEVSTDYPTGAVGPDGTPLVAPENSSCSSFDALAAISSSEGVSTVGSAFQVGGENRWNMICPPVGPAPGTSFIDNRAPAVYVAGAGFAGPILGKVAFNDLFDQQWINGSYANFGQYDVVTAPNNDLLATDGGVGLAAAMPEVHVATVIVASPFYACTSAVFDHTTAAETLTSNATDGYRVCTYAADQLGNSAGSGPSNYFGLDRGVPVSRLAGSAVSGTPALVGMVTSPVSSTADTTTYANNPGFTTVYPAFPATAVWGLEGVDNRAGFNQNVVTGYPSVQLISKLGGALAYVPVPTCLAATNFTMPTVLGDQYVRSTALDFLDCGALSGYYKFSGYVVDRAGNQSVAINRNFVRDDNAVTGRPSIAGVLPLPLLTAGTAASFTILGSDDVELIGAQLTLAQAVQVGGPGTSLRYPNAAGLGIKWDLVLSNVLNNGTVSINPFLFRVDETCSAAGVPYAGCPAPNVPALDIQPVVVAAPVTGAPYTASAAALPTSVTADVFDVAAQFSGTPVTTPFQAAMFNPTTGAVAIWPGAPNLASWSAVVSGTSAVAVHKGSTSIQTPYFEAVALYRLNGTSWVFCGNFPNNPGTNPASNNPYSNDQGVNRFWNYTLALPTVGACTAGTAWRVMGIKAGAGLFTQNF